MYKKVEKAVIYLLAFISVIRAFVLVTNINYMIIGNDCKITTLTTETVGSKLEISNIEWEKMSKLSKDILYQRLPLLLVPR